MINGQLCNSTYFVVCVYFSCRKWVSLSAFLRLCLDRWWCWWFTYKTCFSIKKNKIGEKKTELKWSCRHGMILYTKKNFNWSLFEFEFWGYLVGFRIFGSSRLFLWLLRLWKTKRNKIAWLSVKLNKCCLGCRVVSAVWVLFWIKLFSHSALHSEDRNKKIQKLKKEKREHWH